MSNISVETFNQNFTTYIRGFEEGHIDETGSYDFGVGFNVICNNNNRVMYFEAHVNSNMLPENYTQCNLKDTAWSNIVPDVKAWATSVINSSNILGHSYVPSVATNSNLDFSTTSNFNYATFSSNFNLTVSRMETYPMNYPSCWCVGFFASKSNDTSISLILDTQVKVNTFAIFKAEQEILDLGWSNLKERFGLWAENIYHESSFVNTTYSASNW